MEENRRIYLLTMIHIALGGILGYFIAQNGIDGASQVAICVSGTAVAAWHLWSSKTIKPAIPVIALTITALVVSRIL